MLCVVGLVAGSLKLRLQVSEPALTVLKLPLKINSSGVGKQLVGGKPAEACEHLYLESLVFLLLFLLPLQQLLNMSVQTVSLDAHVLLQVCIPPLFFIQTGLQRANLLILNTQLRLLQQHSKP